MDSKKLKKAIKKSDLYLVRSKGGHGIYRCTCSGKHTFTVANSISDGRGIKNLIGDMRRSGCSTVKNIVK